MWVCGCVDGMQAVASLETLHGAEWGRPQRMDVPTVAQHLIIAGPPAGGKGSLCEALLKAYPGIVHISTGDLLRAAVKASPAHAMIATMAPTESAPPSPSGGCPAGR